MKIKNIAKGLFILLVLSAYARAQTTPTFSELYGMVEAMSARADRCRISVIVHNKIKGNDCMQMATLLNKIITLGEDEVYVSILKGNPSADIDQMTRWIRNTKNVVEFLKSYGR